MEKVAAGSTTSVYFHDGLDVVADYDERERRHSGLRVQWTPVATNSVRRNKNVPISPQEVEESEVMKMRQRAEGRSMSQESRPPFYDRGKEWGIYPNQ